VSDAGEIAKAVSPISDLVGKLFGPMADELGQYFGDKVRAFRQRNLTSVLEGTQKILDGQATEAGPIPPRLLLPLVESASLEDDSLLQDMWSGLIANASSTTEAVSPAFIETLKQLGPDDARSLMHVRGLVEDSSQKYNLERFNVPLNRHTLRYEAELDDAGLETFERLGLLRREYDVSQSEGMYFEGNQPITVQGDPEIDYCWQITRYGLRFYSACAGNRYDGPPIDTTPAFRLDTECCSRRITCGAWRISCHWR